MKATLEFNLDDPSDARAHIRCVKSLDMALVLWEISIRLNKTVEHKVESMEDIPTTAWDGVRIVTEEITEIFQKYNINIDDLID